VSGIRDNPALKRYELDVPGGVAFIKYLRKPGVVMLLHAEVPRELRGRGFGSQLTRQTLDFLRAEGVTVEPHCSYVATWMHRHPEYRDLIA
jgi:predicted GNAT family acetyltransferase